MKQTLGALIADLRKALGLTQAQLAEKLGVTDKAVSKWERDLSCPDIGTLPRLAEVLGVSVDQLMQGEKPERREAPLLPLILKAVALAMGVAVTVLTALGKLEVSSGMTMLGIGLIAVAGYLFQTEK